MAAEVLARAGASVTVYEQMPSMGRKFLIAGRGGLNITHSEPLEQFLTRYGDKSAALGPSVSAFPPAAVEAWCEDLSQKSFVGSSGRVFPLGFRATELLRSWLAGLEGLGVRLLTSHRWLGWDRVTGALLVAADEKDSDQVEPQQLFPDITVMSLGGGSWQRTGSDGRWVPKFQEIGINVHKLRPANSGFLVDWTAEFISKFEGMPVKNVAVQARGNPVPAEIVFGETVRGEMMISAEGIEGGCVYAVGRELRAACDAQGNTIVRCSSFAAHTRISASESFSTRALKSARSFLVSKLSTTGSEPAWCSAWQVRRSRPSEAREHSRNTHVSSSRGRSSRCPEAGCKTISAGVFMAAGAA